MSAAPSIDFNAFLSHEDAGVRSRAWVWQSAVGLLAVEGRVPSAYLVETARRHIEGALPLELACKLVEACCATQGGASAESADRQCLEMVRMLGGVPAASAEAPSAPAKTAPAPADGATLHNRHKRLLKTLAGGPLGVAELLHALRLNNRQSFMRVWLTPAMEMGLVKPLHPESPRYPGQKYRLSREGQRALRQLIRKS